MVAEATNVVGIYVGLDDEADEGMNVG